MKRRKEEMKQMEGMRKDEREHELCLFQLLGQLISPPPVQIPYGYVPPP